MPRTPDGQPDLQGNWTNGTLTPLERPAGLPRALTPEQVARFEKIRSDTVEKLSKQSDPNRPAPPKGGDGSTGAAGNVGGYNYFWIDAGDHMATVNGERRSSLIVDPANGRVPALTPAARVGAGPHAARAAQFGRTTTRRTGPSPNAASCRSARTPGRRCCRTISTTTTTPSCRRRTTS